MCPRRRDHLPQPPLSETWELETQREVTAGSSRGTTCSARLSSWQPQAKKNTTTRVQVVRPKPFRSSIWTDAFLQNYPCEFAVAFEGPLHKSVLLDRINWQRSTGRGGVGWDGGGHEGQLGDKSMHSNRHNQQRQKSLCGGGGCGGDDSRPSLREQERPKAGTQPSQRCEESLLRVQG